MPIERIDNLNRYTQLQQGNKINNTAGQSPLIQDRQTTNPIIEDSVEFLNAQKEQRLSDKQEKVKKIRKEFEDIKKHQALIGKSWDKIKNIIGKKTGSAYVEKQIKAYEKGEITEEEVLKALEEYKSGQEESVETVADIISGISALGFYTLAITTAPLYGLGVIALGAITASIAGATVKTVTKYADAHARDKKYNAYTNDILTGAFSGILAPITGGIGGTVGKTVAKKLGIKAISETGMNFSKLGFKNILFSLNNFKKICFSSIKTNQTKLVRNNILFKGIKKNGEKKIKSRVKSTIEKILLNPTGFKYTGGNVLKRSLAFGAECATDGAIGGAIDNMFRAVLNNDNVLEAGITGFTGGLIMSPVIGGGVKAIGKTANTMIKNKNIKIITDLYKKIKSTEEINFETINIVEKNGNIGYKNNFIGLYTKSSFQKIEEVMKKSSNKTIDITNLIPRDKSVSSIFISKLGKSTFTLKVEKFDGTSADFIIKKKNGTSDFYYEIFDKKNKIIETRYPISEEKILKFRKLKNGNICLSETDYICLTKATQNISFPEGAYHKFRSTNNLEYGIIFGKNNQIKRIGIIFGKTFIEIDANGKVKNISKIDTEGIQKVDKDGIAMTDKDGKKLFEKYPDNKTHILRIKEETIISESNYKDREKIIKFLSNTCNFNFLYMDKLSEILNNVETYKAFSSFITRMQGKFPHLTFTKEQAQNLLEIFYNMYKSTATAGIRFTDVTDEDTLLRSIFTNPLPFNINKNVQNDVINHITTFDIKHSQVSPPTISGCHVATPYLKLESMKQGESLIRNGDSIWNNFDNKITSIKKIGEYEINEIKFHEFEFCINNNGQNQKIIIRISRAPSNNESTQIARTLSDNNLIEYKIESVRLNAASHKNFEFSGTKTVINEKLLNKIIHQFKKSPELYVLHAGTPKLHGFFRCNGIYFECYLPGTIYPCSRQHIESRLASADINKIPDITHN